MTFRAAARPVGSASRGQYDLSQTTSIRRESFAIPNKPKNLAETRKDWERDVPVWIKLAVDLGIKLIDDEAECPMQWPGATALHQNVRFRPRLSMSAMKLVGG